MMNTLFNKVLGENEKCVFHFGFKKQRQETFGQLSILASDSANLHLPLAVEHRVPRLLFTRTQSPLEKWLLSETEPGKIEVSLEPIIMPET